MTDPDISSFLHNKIKTIQSSDSPKFIKSHLLFNLAQNTDIPTKTKSEIFTALRTQYLVDLDYQAPEVLSVLEPVISQVFLADFFEKESFIFSI